MIGRKPASRMAPTRGTASGFRCRMIPLGLHGYEHTPPNIGRCVSPMAARRFESLRTLWLIASRSQSASTKNHIWWPVCSRPRTSRTVLVLLPPYVRDLFARAAFRFFGDPKTSAHWAWAASASALVDLVVITR
eukprot:7222171-Prymnesium_polylepis.1